MSVEEILIVKCKGVAFGIDTCYVDQILRVPAITPIVLSHPHILGLSAVSGTILSIFDLNLLLGIAKVDTKAEQSRILTLQNVKGQSALLVDEVADTVMVKASHYERIENAKDAIIGLYKQDDEIVQIVDIEKLQSHVTLKSFDFFDVKDGTSQRNGSSKRHHHTQRYLFLKMGKERFAIDIDMLREIIMLPDAFTPIAGSSSEILGMMPLRNELLLVVDLRRFFGFDTTLQESNRILVVQHGSMTLGLVIDDILDIREVDEERVNTMPSNFEDDKISGVIRHKEQLISLIGPSVIEQLMLPSQELIQQNDAKERVQEAREISLEVVAFKLGAEEYAINIEDVVEIIDNVDVTPLKDAPPLVDGLINIRGQVVTLVSVYEWLNKEQDPLREKKIIICQIDDHRVGFFVDSVSDVMEIASEEVREAEESQFFSATLYLEGGKRLALLFDIHKLSQHKDAA